MKTEREIQERINTLRINLSQVQLEKMDYAEMCIRNKIKELNWCLGNEI